MLYWCGLTWRRNMVDWRGVLWIWSGEAGVEMWWTGVVAMWIDKVMRLL